METINRKPTTKFLNTSKKMARAEFKEYLKDEGEWFFNIVEKLSKNWGEGEIVSSGMLVRENEQPVLLIGGACIGCQDTTSEKISVGMQDLVFIVRLFSEIRESGGVGEVITFTFYVEELGLFAGSYSVDTTSAAITIKFLSKGYPKLESIGYEDQYLDLVKNIIETRVYETPFGKRAVEVVRRKGLVVHAGTPDGGESAAVAAEMNFLLEKANILMHAYETQIEYRFHRPHMGVLRQYEIGTDISGDTMQDIAIKIRRNIVENRAGVVVFGKIISPELIREAVLAASGGRHVIVLLPETSMGAVLKKLSDALVGQESLLAETLRAVVIHSAGEDGKSKRQDVLIIKEEEKEYIRKNKIDKLRNKSK